MTRSNKRKRKNKTVNVSGERSQKVHVSNPQTSVPSLHGMESMINSSINNSFIAQQAQHSTPNTATMQQEDFYEKERLYKKKLKCVNLRHRVEMKKTTV